VSAPSDSPAGDSASDGPCEQAGTFEHSLAELEAIVHELEDGQIGLAQALRRYEQGVKHLRHCYQLLAHAERKIELLTGMTEGGVAITQPFDAAIEDPAQSVGKRRARRTSSQRGAIAGDIDDPAAGI
jgi:exodeoxyribonuclease VII small subunit